MNFLVIFLFTFCGIEQILTADNLSCLSDSSKTPVPGAGGTFGQVIYSEWIYAYEISSQGQSVDICYDPCGSGCGKSCIISGVDSFGNSCRVAYAGSDSVLSPQNYQQVPDLQMYPVVAGAIVPMYNLGSSTLRAELVLGREVLAQIFMCEITHWRDPKIVGLNSGDNQLCPKGNTSSPDCQLPNANIRVFHRSDSSGTTEVFTKALYSFSDSWKQLCGSPNSSWPSVLDQKCKQGSASGNYGTFSMVNANNYSISYVANSVLVNTETGRYARMVNRDNFTVDASVQSIQTAMKYTVFNEQFVGDCIDEPGESWPISTFTYLIFRKNQSEGNPSWFGGCDSTREAVKFWVWTLLTESARQRAEALGYAPLEINLASNVSTRIQSEVYCEGSPAIIDFKLPVGVILPLTGSEQSEMTPLWKEVMEFANEKVNLSPFYTGQGLRGWKIVFQFRDSTNTQSGALLASSEMIGEGTIALIGEFEDTLSNTIQLMVSDLNLTQVSPQSQEERTESLKEASTLVRMNPDPNEQGTSIVMTSEFIGWKRGVILGTTDSNSVGLSQKIAQVARKVGMNVQSMTLTNVNDESLLVSDLKMVLETGLRVILSCVPNEQLPKVLNESLKQGLMGSGFTWMFGLTEIPGFSEEVPNFGTNQRVQEELVGSFYFSSNFANQTFYQSLLNEMRSLNSSQYPVLVSTVKETNSLDMISLNLYDLVFTLGWGIDLVIANHTEFEVQESHFTELFQVIKEQVSFDGVRGRVRFDEEGDKVAQFTIWNFQETEENGMEWKNVGLFDSTTKITQFWDETNVVISGGSMHSPPPDYVEPPKELISLEWGDPLPNLGIALFVIGEVFVVYLAIEMKHFEERKIIKASSIFFLNLVLVGSAIGLGGIFLFVVPATKVTCVLGNWLCWTGFTLVFGGLFAKTYRVYKIFSNSDLKGMSLSNSRLLSHTVALFCINGILLILWDSIDTPFVTKHGPYYQSSKESERCTSSHEAVWVTLYLIPYFFVVIGLSVISFLSRHVASGFNESKYLAMANYHFTFCFIVSVAISIPLNSFLEFELGIRMVGLWIGVIGLLSVLYLPKIYTCYFAVEKSNTLGGSSPSTSKSAKPGVHTSHLSNVSS